jgi:hypothetical protein
MVLAKLRCADELSLARVFTADSRRYFLSSIGNSFVPRRNQRIGRWSIAWDYAV